MADGVMKNQWKLFLEGFVLLQFGCSPFLFRFLEKISCDFWNELEKFLIGLVLDFNA